MRSPRANKYRRLAMVEPDADKAHLLDRLAEEAERGALCTANWRRSVPVLSVQIPVAVSKS